MMKRVILIIFILSLLPYPVLAQCSDCWYTPTPTSTTAPTATPGAGTPTAAPMPTAISFPQFAVPAPTAIPTINFPGPPSPIAPQFTPLPSPEVGLTAVVSPALPALPSPVVVSTPAISPVATLVVVWPEPMIISHTEFITFTTSDITNTVIYSQAASVISQTNDLIYYLITMTNEITAENITATEEITILTAPPDYAPDFPRPLADVGWTFEVIGTDDPQAQYTLSSWAALITYIISLPIRLIRGLWQLVAYMGPIGLFIAWLFVMLAIMLAISILRFVYHVVITVIDVIIKILDLIGQYAPTGG